LRPPCPDVAAPEAPPGPPCCVTFSRGVGCAALAPSRPPRPVVCGCCCPCRAVAEAPGTPDGRADCCGAARGGAARGAAACAGACRGAAICGAGRGADACGAGAARGAGAACGAGAGRAAGAAEAAGPPRPGGAPPPCFCGCAAAVVAITAEMMKHAAIRVVFHWNMAPPPASPALPQRASWRAGFVCARPTRATHSMTVCSESPPRLQETDRRSRCGSAHAVHARTHAEEERSCAWGRRDRWRCDASRRMRPPFATVAFAVSSGPGHHRIINVPAP
jgi:hypothetical protein